MIKRFCPLLTNTIKKTIRFSSTTTEEHHHREIDNKIEILKEIDNSLKRKEAPSVEYIYVESDFKRLFGFGNGSGSNSAANPYGHSALRYTLWKGDKEREKSVVMNISGASGYPLVSISHASDYLFGHSGSEQGGVYLRAMRGFRIEDVPEEKIQKMHKYFLELQEREKRGEVKYSFLFGNTLPFFNRGLKEAEILPSLTMFPKILFVRFYFMMLGIEKRTSLLSLSNSNIVAYRKYAAAKDDPLADSWIAPSWFLSSQGKIFRALERLANVVVATPPIPKKKEELWLSYCEVVEKPARPFSQIQASLGRKKE